jgi:Transposase DNA-binding/Transposase Tn5 dimerisation domain
MLVVDVVTAGRTLGDRRRGARLARLVDALAAHCEARLSRALGSWAAAKAAYRFFACPAVTPAGILASARPALDAALVGQETVLLLQDTTSLDFTSHEATRGLGPIGTRAQQHRGILVHSALAVSVAGVPLGLAAQEQWTRPPGQTGRLPPRRTRAAAAKESARWQRVEAASRAVIPDGVHTITVADREADLFALFAAPRPATAALLIRVAQTTRRVEEAAASVAAAAQAAPVWGRYSVSVRAEPGRPARTALCAVGVIPVTLRPPQNQRAGERWTVPVALTLVVAREESPPPGVPPLHWLLVTTLAVPDFSTAAQVLYLYTLRWLIERFHFVLKSGGQIEEVRLQEAARLQRAVAVYSLVALSVLNLTYLARDAPDLPCTVALSAAEWQTLSCHVQQTAQPAAQPPLLGEATRQIAQLGGFLGRRGDGDPGPLTIWRGYRRLQDMTAARLLALGSPAVTRCG